MAGRGRGQVNTKQVYIDPRQAFQGRTRDAKEIFTQRLEELITEGRGNRDWTTLISLVSSNMSSFTGKKSDMKEPLFQRMYKAAIEDLLTSNINEEKFLDSHWNDIFKEEFYKTLKQLKTEIPATFDLEIDFNKPILYKDELEYNEKVWGEKEKFNVIGYSQESLYWSNVFTSDDMTNKFYNQVVPTVKKLQKEGNIKDIESVCYDMSYRLGDIFKSADYEYNGTSMMSLDQAADLADRLWRKDGVKTAAFEKRNPGKYRKGNYKIFTTHSVMLKNELTTRNIEELTPEVVEEKIDKVAKKLVSNQIFSLMNKDISSKRYKSQSSLLYDNLEKTTKDSYLKRLAPLFGSDKDRKDLYSCIKENKDLISQMSNSQIIEIINVAGAALWDENKASLANEELRSQQPKPKSYQQLCYIEPTSNSTTQAAILYAIENITENQA